MPISEDAKLPITRPCKPSGFIAKKSLVHIVVFKFFIRYASPNKTIRERVQ